MNVIVEQSNRLKATAATMKGRIATLMADGRYRTFNDVCVALKIKDSDRADVKGAMRSLKAMGVLRSYNSESDMTVIWVKRDDT